MVVHDGELTWPANGRRVRRRRRLHGVVANHGYTQTKQRLTYDGVAQGYRTARHRAHAGRDVPDLHRQPQHVGARPLSAHRMDVRNPLDPPPM